MFAVDDKGHLIHASLVDLLCIEDLANKEVLFKVGEANQRLQEVRIT